MRWREFRDFLRWLPRSFWVVTGPWALGVVAIATHEWLTYGAWALIRFLLIILICLVLGGIIGHIVTPR